MRIVEASLTPLRLELATPLRTARATYAARCGLVVHLTDEQGHLGRGEAMPLPEFGTESLDVCARVLSRALGELRGAVLVDGAQALARLVRCPAARHAVEQALLDLLAQRRGLPLCRLLEPTARAEVEVCALLTAATPEGLAAESQAALAAGYGAVKLKVAGRPLAADEARVEAVRDAVGPAVRIRLDANGGWSEDQASEAVARLARFAPELCEQPVPAEALEALIRVQRGSPIPLAADEALGVPKAIEALLGAPHERPAVPIFVLKPMVLGGLRVALALARRVHAAGAEVFVTSSLDGAVARAGAAHLAAALPSSRLAAGLGVGRLFADPAPSAFDPVAGRIRLPNTGGLGFLS